MHALATRMRRGRAERLLLAVVEVARDINADAGMAHYVRKLSVFGSYLSGEAVLTGLDIAYALGVRGEADAQNAALIVRCLKLRQGIALCEHSALDAAAAPHLILFEIE